MTALTLQLISGLALIVAWLPFAYSCIAHHSPAYRQALSVATFMAGGVLSIEAAVGAYHPCAAGAASILAVALLIWRTRVRHSLEKSCN